MILYIKEKTKTLTLLEKAYVLFYWHYENIEYDIKGKLNDNSDCSPEGVYKNGYGVCSGYSRLYNYIGTNLGLKIENIQGY